MNEQTAREKILIVDDEERVRESIGEVLSDEGYQVMDSADGSSVLELIGREKPAPRSAA